MTTGTGNLLAQVVMLGFIPFCVALFLLMQPVRAAATGLVLGFLFLPNTAFKFSGIPDYDKLAAMTLGVMVAGFVLDSGRFFKFRPRWVDVPVLLLIFSSAISSYLNGLGIWDALSSLFKDCVRWGGPWFLGRVYFGTAMAQRELASTIVAGALLYVPLCLIEIKMSPVLHSRIYGVKLLTVKHSQRGALWRPNVFIENGLMCALFLSLATVLAFFLWRSRSRRKILRLPMSLVTGLLTLITVGASSAMAFLVMVTGIATLVLGRRMRFSLPLLLMILLPPTWVGVRQFGGWEGRELYFIAKTAFGQLRANSLFTRISAENELRDIAAEQIWFGYGVEQDFTGNTGRDDPSKGGVSLAVDSMWMWYMGLQGILGVTCLYGTLLLAGWLAWRHVPSRYWGHPIVGMPLAMGLVGVLYAQDSLLNAFENQLFVVVVGGAAGSLASRSQRRALGL